MSFLEQYLSNKQIKEKMPWFPTADNTNSGIIVPVCEYAWMNHI